MMYHSFKDERVCIPMVENTQEEEKTKIYEERNLRWILFITIVSTKSGFS